MSHRINRKRRILKDFEVRQFEAFQASPARQFEAFQASQAKVPHMDKGLEGGNIAAEPVIQTGGETTGRFINQQGI